MAAGCAVDPAPKDADGVLRWEWLNAGKATDAQMLDALEHLHAAVDGDTRTEEIDGTLEPLRDGDTDIVPMEHPGNPATAHGLLIVRVVHCPFDETVRQFFEADQKKLHPSYDSYSREYLSDVAAWHDSRANTLDYLSTYRVSLLGSSYVATIHGQARRVPARRAGTPPGPLVVTRQWLPKDGVFTGSDTDFFRQDYQVQMFWERKPGEVMHAFGLWRDLRFAGFTLDDDTFVSGSLSSLSKGDDDIENACVR